MLRSHHRRSMTAQGLSMNSRTVTKGLVFPTNTQTTLRNTYNHSAEVRTTNARKNSTLVLCFCLKYACERIKYHYAVTFALVTSSTLNLFLKLSHSNPKGYFPTTGV